VRHFGAKHSPTHLAEYDQKLKPPPGGAMLPMEPQISATPARQAFPPPGSEERRERCRRFAAMYETQTKARNVNHYPPTDDLYLLLADIMDPATVKLSEWNPNSNSEPELRKGDAVFVSSGST
jgi:hypothetical protein